VKPLTDLQIWAVNCIKGEGAEGGERIGKGEEGLDLDICPGDPDFLVTPLE